jgi:hypothetical protein
MLGTQRTELVLGRRGEHSVVPDVTADAHESLTAACWLAEFVPKNTTTPGPAPLAGA